MNNLAYFEIQSDEPSKAVAFYRAAFDWKFTKDESLPIEYYRIETDSINGGILKRPVQTPPMQYGTNAFTCSMQVSNFDETAKKIMDQGGQVAMEKFAVPGKCWQGYFLDLDHNVFGIFQVDELAK